MVRHPLHGSERTIPEDARILGDAHPAAVDGVADPLDVTGPFEAVDQHADGR